MSTLQFITFALRSSTDDSAANQVALWIPFVIAGAYITFRNIVRSKREQGLFPSYWGNTPDNMLKAYISLGARMVQADREDSGQKIKYMYKNFERYFPEHHVNLRDSLRYATKYPVKIKSVGKWLHSRLDYKQRLQVMYFLMGMSYVDGTLNMNELLILQEMKEVLEISPKDFQSMRSMYDQKNERKREEKKQQERKERPVPEYKKKSALKLSSEILGVSEQASMDEVKKAYRSLVKLHHPDRFATDSIEQQNIANERFLEIQKAYEVFEKYR
jgi:DnaJ like chaperone protein